MLYVNNIVIKPKRVLKSFECNIVTDPMQHLFVQLCCMQQKLHSVYPPKYMVTTYIYKEEWTQTLGKILATSNEPCSGKLVAKNDCEL